MAPSHALPPGHRLTSEQVLSVDRSAEDVLWREHDSGFQEATTDPPLEAHRVVGLRDRIARAITAPALIGAGVLLLAVVVAVVMTMTRSHLTPSESAEAVVDTAEQDGSAGGAVTGAEGGSDRDTGSAAEPARAIIYVHVIGEVKRPGVVKLGSDDRVSDALEAAGGATEAAVLDAVNLARPVVDGEQIVVPDAETAAQTAAGGATGGSGSGSGSSAATGSEAPDAPMAGGGVSLNSADGTALDSLPGVGPALAQRIIEWREANGGFSDVEQLLEVSGIGEKKLDGLRDQVTL